MPRPPPPPLAFSSSGNPISARLHWRARATVNPSRDPGTTGIPIARRSGARRPCRPCAKASAFGPMKVSPASLHRSAKALFSARKSIARINRIAFRARGGLHQRGAVQIAGIRGRRPDADGVIGCPTCGEFDPPRNRRRDFSPNCGTRGSLAGQSLRDWRSARAASLRLPVAGSVSADGTGYNCRTRKNHIARLFVSVFDNYYAASSRPTFV